jgi:ligand-binding SRPBCC domain-containing protein
MIFRGSITIAAPIADVFAFHDETSNLPGITPSGIRMEILDVRGQGLGKQVRLRMTQFGILSNIILIEFVEYQPPNRLSDQQRKGPFKHWRQRRDFREVPGGTEMTDTVEYTLPFGWLGRLADVLVVAPRIRRMFAYRQQRTRQLIESGDCRQSHV